MRPLRPLGNDLKDERSDYERPRICRGGLFGWARIGNVMGEGLARVLRRMPVARIPNMAGFALPPKTRPTPAGRPRIFRCRTCGRSELRAADPRYRLTPVPGPECCGRPMVPDVITPERGSDPDADAVPWADRRLDDRRSIRPGAGFRLWHGKSSPDLAIALIDASSTGLKVAIRGPLCSGDHVFLLLGPPGGAWMYRGQGVVSWCVVGAEGTALAGIQLQQSLTASEIADLTESRVRPASRGPSVEVGDSSPDAIAPVVTAGN